MLTVTITPITPDKQTYYLVGPEGLVWVQPAVGEPHIIAARNDEERQAAAQFIAELLNQGLVPYGLPLGHRATVALFGGPVTRDCRWIVHADAPLPTGDAGDELPAHAAVITH